MTLFDIVYMILITILFTVIDRKYKVVRMKYIYHENVWLNLLSNFIFVVAFTLLSKLLFKY